jgi:AraC family transcriptional regulator of adaptative response / DNA-3-methyladenine glycosylase II
VKILVPYVAPFDFDAAAAWIGRRAIHGVESLTDGVYRRGTIEIAHDAASHAMVVNDVSAVAATRRLFDLDADPHAIAAHFAGDPLIGPESRRRPGIRVPGSWDPFETAVRAVVGQQVSVAAASTLMNRIAARFGGFPSPEQLAAVEIDGMPRARAETVQRIAAAIANGVIRFDAPLDVLIENLTSIRGIGPWTAHYIAMRGAGHRDAFPAGDLILRRAANMTEKELLRRAEAWRPYRAYAAMWLWMRPSAPPSF